MASASTWILYGIHKGDFVIIIANILVLSYSLIIFILKIKNKENNSIKLF